MRNLALTIALCLALPLASIAQPPKTVAAPRTPDRSAAPGENDLPTQEEFREELPEGSRLTGREIYERFLRNRYRRSTQKMRVVSRDPGGSEQTTVFEASLEDHRNTDDQAVEGIRAKLLVKVSSPFDMRHTRYLIVARDPGPDDEWVYQPSERRVRRARLKTTPLMGTDYTFDDVAYHDIEQADYERLDDAVVDGVPVYVVEATVKETRDVAYYKTVSYIEMEHYVPLRVNYWDEFGVELRRMEAKHETLRAFGEMWVATESSMTNLLQQTSSSMHVDAVDTNPVFHEKLFSLAQMTRGL